MCVIVYEYTVEWRISYEGTFDRQFILEGSEETDERWLFLSGKELKRSVNFIDSHETAKSNSKEPVMI